MRDERLTAGSRMGRHLIHLARSWAEAGQMDGQHKVQALRRVERGYRQCGDHWSAQAVRQQIRRRRR